MPSLSRFLVVTVLALTAVTRAAPYAVASDYEFDLYARQDDGSCDPDPGTGGGTDPDPGTGGGGTTPDPGDDDECTPGTGKFTKT